MSGNTNANNSNEGGGKTYWIILLLMVVTGAFNTIFLQLQNVAYEKILGAPFSHPWFQSILMFIGEFYCAIMWIFMKKTLIRKDMEEEQAKEAARNTFINSNTRISTKSKADKPDASPIIFLIPCACDIIGSTLLNFALLNMAGSIFQMLRGGLIIITCIFMIIFLKKYPKNYQWLGVGIVFLGIFLVGLATQLDDHTSEGQVETTVFGIVILLVSLLFQGFQMVYEEKIMSQYKSYPMQVVAWEGTWGLLAFLIMLPIFQFVPCNFSGKESICSPGPNGKYLLEDSVFAFKQMWEELPILFYSIGQTFSICGFNLFGIMLVKYSSAASRSVMDSARTVLVWVFFLTVPMANGKKTEHFLWIELIGFIVMVFGQIIYNGLIVIPFLGFDKHFKKPVEVDQEKGFLADGYKSVEEEEENENEELENSIDMRRSFAERR